MLISLFGGQRMASDSSDRSPWGDFFFKPIGLPSASGMRVTAAASLQLPIVWDCINVLAKSFAMMSFTVYQSAEEPADRKALRKHWLFRLIAKRPNEFQSPFEWKLMLMGHLALRGNAFCQVGTNSRGEITDLLPLHPDRMQIEVLPSGNWRYKYTDQNGKAVYYTRGEIWHLRWMSDDGIVGLSPIDIAREAIGEGLAMQGYSSRFFANDARPGGWIEHTGSFANEATRQAFKDSWQKAYSGRNVRKVAVLERGMKYHELTLKNSDAQFVEARREKAYEIPRIWGIPPHKVGVLDKATFSNIEQQNIEFWTDTMMPWGKMWSDSIETFLLGGDETLDCEFDAKPMMRGDAVARATRIRSLVLSGVMKPNEGRAEEGYAPVTGGDRLLIPVNMGIMEEDGEVEVVGGGEATEQPGAPDDGSGERLQAVLSASASRLARRAAGELARKPAAAVFDDDFARLMAESMAVSHQRAAMWCAKLRAADVHTAETIERGLLACAIGA